MPAHKTPSKKALKKSRPAVKKKATSAAVVSGPAVGAKAPAFSMPVTGGGVVSSATLKGKPFVLYFYPKDNTPGCTKEACDFQDNLAQFNRVGATVIGVSKDNLKSHDSFAKKFGLKFPLASDEETEVAKRFGTWIKKSMYGRSYMGMERATFLIDAKGVVRGVWRKVSVSGHVDDVIKTLKKL